MAAWETGLDDSDIYGTGSNAVGVCYNDSAFDEAITINGGGGFGMGSRRLTVAEADRHTGIAGTGARVVKTSSAVTAIHLTITNSVVEWLEYDCNGQDVDAIFRVGTSQTTGNADIFRNCIGHGAVNGKYGCHQAEANRTSTWMNLIIYNLAVTQGGSGSATYGIYVRDADAVAYNCTVHDINRTDNAPTGENYGVFRSSGTVKNCIATDITSDFALNELLDFKSLNASSTHNLSEDASADDAGDSNALINQNPADLFVSITLGSEDFHLVDTAVAIGAGDNLGTTPPGVNIDIDGTTRGVIWDMGAHENSRDIPADAAGASKPSRRNVTLAYLSGA
jgi:hypothetical protein